MSLSVFNDGVGKFILQRRGDMECPRCGNQLSDRSKFCSNCGCEISSDLAEHTGTTQGNSTNTKKKRRILAIFAIISIAIVLFYLYKDTVENESADEYAVIIQHSYSNDVSIPSIDTIIYDKYNPELQGKSFYTDSGMPVTDSYNREISYDTEYIDYGPSVNYHNYQLNQSPQRDTNTKTPIPNDVVSVEKLAADYKQNYISANNKYANRTLSVYGKIYSISSTLSSYGYVDVEMFVSDPWFSAYFEFNESDPSLFSLATGEYVTITGFANPSDSGGSIRITNASLHDDVTASSDISSASAKNNPSSKSIIDSGYYYCDSDELYLYVELKGDTYYFTVSYEDMIEKEAMYWYFSGVFDSSSNSVYYSNCKAVSTGMSHSETTLYENGSGEIWADNNLYIYWHDNQIGETLAFYIDD